MATLCTSMLSSLCFQATSCLLLESAGLTACCSVLVCLSSCVCCGCVALSRRDQLEIVKFLNTAENPILGLNVVIDDQRRLGFASYGSIVASHAQAVDFVRSFAEVGVEGPKFGTVLTSSAGYPLDKTYYQTVKGMCLALGVLAPGGDLIIVSENSEGLGSEEFKESQKNLADMGSEKFLEMVLAKSHADIDEWETEMLLRAERASSGNIFMYSPGLSAEDRALTCCNMIDDSVDEALERSLKKQDSGSASRRRIAVIPEVCATPPSCLFRCLLDACWCSLMQGYACTCVLGAHAIVQGPYVIPFIK
jgi:nickel-dependent lactate racemase